MTKPKLAALSLILFTSSVIYILGGFDNFVGRLLNSPQHTPSTTNSNAHKPESFDINLHHSKISIANLPQKSHLPYCLENQKILRTVKVINNSQFAIASSLEKPRGVNLAYRIYSQTNNKILSESHRTLLPKPLLQNEPQRVAIEIQCPPQIGRYTIIIDLVQEGVAWQHTIKNSTGYFKLPIEVVDGPPSNKNTSPTGTALHIASTIVSQSVSSWPDKRNMLVSFAGSQYPQVWARDMATIQRAYLTMLPNTYWEHHWSELFFERFTPEKGIPDWVSPNSNRQDKNDILSDQELWTVIASAEAYLGSHLSDQWLQENQKNMLDLITWSIDNRWDTDQRCLWNGHTADWGDVGLKGKGIDSTKLAPPRVCSLFSQALLFHAIELIEEIPITLDTSHLKKIQRQIENFVEKSLWQPEKGFYRIHKHLDHIRHEFDESNIFPLGGHVVAMESGLITGYRRKLILKKIVERQQKFAISTIGGSLLPPYPAKTFENPIMDEQFEYQNGGQWDWYGTRAASILAQQDKQAGYKAILEISKKAEKNKSFYEWDRPNGEPGHGIHYRASAAAYIWSLAKIPNKQRI